MNFRSLLIIYIYFLLKWVSKQASRLSFSLLNNKSVQDKPKLRRQSRAVAKLEVRKEKCGLHSQDDALNGVHSILKFKLFSLL